MGLSASISQEIDRYAKEKTDFYQRFEDAVSLGVADAYYGATRLGAHRGAWIEIKSASSFRARPRFERGQLAFGVRAAQAGERAFVLVGSPAGLRVYRTAEVAQAVLFDDPWPEPVFEREGAAMPADVGNAIEAMLE